jgi:hypothetical protein
MTISEKLAAASAGKAAAGGLKLTSKPAAPKPKELPPLPRELGSPIPGERVPMRFPAECENEPDAAWLDSTTAFTTDLVIWVEAAPGDLATHAWLAVERGDRADDLILLHRFPVTPRLRPTDPF